MIAEEGAIFPFFNYISILLSKIIIKYNYLREVRQYMSNLFCII